MFNYEAGNPKVKKQRLLLEEIDDVSSESSSSGEDSEGLDMYLQECYYNAYLHYEQEARL
jgi:hypothetical protein